MGNEEAVNRQNNGQKKKDKITNIDIQNITQNTNDRAKLSPTDELICSRSVGSSCTTCGTRRVSLVKKTV